MTVPPDLLRLAAFAEEPGGGNPAGVLVAAVHPPPATMLAIAAAVGYSETAFLAGAGETWDVRYFSPQAEVPFCGHATIAAAVAVFERSGASALRFATPVGAVPVRVAGAPGGARATLTSVEPASAPLAPSDLAHLLALFGWDAAELDPALPPRVAYAGAHHPVLAVRERATLARLAYPFADLRSLMEARGWTTVQAIWRASPERFHARDPFPVGGVVEDPATGAAAAALGGYLRELGAVATPGRFEIRQGEDMGRPSVIHVAVPRSGGIEVSGTAVAIG